MTHSKFAYGASRLGDHLCPAEAAGIGETPSIRWRYDEILSSSPNDKGVVSELIAKGAWKEAIEIVEGRGGRSDGNYCNYDEQLKGAKEIAKRLGWDDIL